MKLPRPNPLAFNRLILAGIALVAAGVSYLTQRDLLLRHNTGEVSAYAIPTTVDLAVIACSLVINTAGVSKDARRLAWIVLSVACTVSIAANWYAGNNLIQRLAHVWCVAIYLGTEAVASKASTRRAPAVARRKPQPRTEAEPEPVAEEKPARKPRVRNTGPRGRTKVVSLDEIEQNNAPDSDLVAA